MPGVSDRTYELVTRLAKFWTFKRRAIASELTEQLSVIQKQLDDLIEANGALSSELHAARRRSISLESTLAQEKAKKASLHERNEELTATNTKLAEERERLRLIKSLLSVEQQKNDELKKLEKLINEEYRRFAAEESSLVDEARAAFDLMGVLHDVKLVVGMPGLLDKIRVAVAGGFSAGKSTFINSLIAKGGVKLAEGITPVTAVPSYVMRSEKTKTRIRAYSHFGAFTEIDESTYARLNHDYMKGFGFDLQRIMPFVALETPMSDLFGVFKHLCFVDTPGYNAGSGAGSTGWDRKTAHDVIREASALIWVMNITDGTIGSDGISFLEQFLSQCDCDQEHMPIFVVLNQADKMPESDIVAVMDEVKELLDDVSISCRGICAYSSTKKEVYTNGIGMELSEFLSEINKIKTNSIGNIVNRIKKVFGLYSLAIWADIGLLEKRIAELNSIKMRALQIGGRELHKNMTTIFNELEKDLSKSSVEHLKKQLVECDRLKDEMIKSVENAILTAIETEYHSVNRL